MDNSDELLCSRCERQISNTDKFCPHCGELFDATMVCSEHPGETAAGVCIACQRPCCQSCGAESGGVFLCSVHSSYEAYEGLARVFGSTDLVQAGYAADILSQAGLHPFVFSRARYPKADVVGFLSFPQVYERTVPEQKVLVPYREIPEAEEILRDLGLIQ